MKLNNVSTRHQYFLNAIKLSVIFSFLVIFGTCNKDEKMDAPPDNENEIAPAFTLNSVDGGQISLSNHSNKVVVLFFFGNNCPSCKAAAPNLESMLVAPFVSRTDYQILGLDQWNGNQASVQAFRTSTGVSFPLLLNAAGVASEYMTTYDRLFVIDKSGKIAFAGTQVVANDMAAVKKKVEMLLGI